MSVQTAYAIYQKLMQEHDMRVALARDAHAEVARAFFDCAEGRGTGPSHALLVKAQHLEDEAKATWTAIQAHVDDTFPPLTN